MSSSKAKNPMPSRPPVRVLILEDNPKDAELMVATLRRVGYPLTYALVDLPAQFQQRLEQGDYDIILADYNLGTWTAMDALEIVKKSAKGVPFVVVTGSVGDEAAVECIKQGAADYVLKHRLERLPVVVDRALRDKAHRVEALHLQEDIHRAKKDWEITFDTVPDPMLVLDEGYHIKRANRAAAALAGLEFAQLLGKRCYEALHGLSEPLPGCPYQCMLMTGKEERSDIKEPLLGKFFDVTATPLRDLNGVVRGCVHVLRDITERKQAETELARLASAVEHTVEPIIITRTDGTIDYVNPAFEQVTGYSRAEAVGQNPRLLRSGKRDEEFYREMWATLTRGEPWAGCLVNKRKDGSLYEAEAVISPVRDAAGQVVNYVSVHRDVTWERRIEEQLREAQKMEAVGRLAGGIAHDFNNLLTVIRGFCDLALERSRPEEPLRGYLEEIKTAGDRAASLTRQLLAFSRRQILSPRVLDLNTVVANLQRILRPLIGEDIELVTLLPPDTGQIKADPSQIEQVILNLAINARDAMPRGGALTLETANVDADEVYARGHPPVVPGRYVVIRVSDTGSGMDRETQVHIFEPFFTTKEPGKGTGLGLSTVYGIVKQSGGYIWLDSEPGQGTTFKVYLPKVDEVVELAEPVSATPRQAGGSETILLVEDEDSVRKLARTVLSAQGYTLLEASRPEDALATCQQHNGPIHLLLTDMVMPRMSGQELAARAAPLHPEISVLYMSGYTDHPAVNYSAVELGAAFLHKPFSPEALVRKVREVLDGVRLKNS